MFEQRKHDYLGNFSRIARGVAVGFLLAAGPSALAESFRLPASGDDLIGNPRHTRAHQEDTLIDIARRFSVGQDEMMLANPTVDRWLPKEGTQVLIPKEYILPNAPRAGIVVNIPEMRLYYFPVRVTARKSTAGAKTPAAPNKAAANNCKPAAGKPVAASKPTGSGNGKSATKPPSASSAKPAAKPVAKPCVPAATTPKPKPVAAETVYEPAGSGEVITYPVSMGRMDWRTPIGKTTVINKQKDPSWTPPASIKREHAAKGDPLPDVVPPGPDNPLGKFAMRLGVPGYLIHGTDAAKADGIGMRVTHGCMRMYNEDIAQLFPQIPVGTPVYLVNQPVKLGWRGSRLYMEISEPLDEDVGIAPHDVDDDISKEQQAREDAKRASFLLSLARSEIQKMKDKTEVMVDMDKVRRAIERPLGIPVVIGGMGSGWEQAAASDEGLAPPAKGKDDDPNASGLGVSSSSTARTPPAPIRPADDSANRRIPASSTTAYSTGPATREASTHPYEAEPYKDEGDEVLYSPDNPYNPSREVGEDDYERPADARSSPYPSGYEAEDVDMTEATEE